MEVVFLGTGTSTGIPQIGCECDICKSDDPKDKRLRSSVFIKTHNVKILIDCGPDLRQQLLQTNITSLDAVLITHGHYDHIGGLDDVRPLGETYVFAEKGVIHQIKTAMPYCFAENRYPGVPVLHLNEISTSKFNVKGIEIQPVRVMHAKLPILGFRIGKMAYLTDVKYLSDETVDQLSGLDVLIINALRIKKHIAHISLDEALEYAERIGAKKTYFTHFSHDLGKHQLVKVQMPENVFLSYDNLKIKI